MPRWLDSAEMAGDEHQRVLAFVVEVHDLVRPDEEDTEDPPSGHDGHGDLAMRRAEAGERDSDGRFGEQPRPLCRRPERGPVVVVGAEMADADRHALARRDANDAFARKDLGADARDRVAARAEGEETAGYSRIWWMRGEAAYPR